MSDTLKMVDEFCPECGTPRADAAGTGGVCPRCLIATAVENLSTIDHPAIGASADAGSAPSIEALNQQLPAFEFLGVLGRGGAGWVFRARQRSLDRPVAIKILRSRADALCDAAQRFTQEAQILARLRHPRIVAVYDHGAVDELRYFAMEYIAGPTLREVLAVERLESSAAVRVTDQICEAVEYAHSMGVLHRDLKPENVLFESADTLAGLKVADFGISRLIDGTQLGTHRTQTGLVVGTPYYVAPEQAAADRNLDARVDVYSIGVMLYEMLTGQLPRGRFPKPSQVAKLPQALDPVVMRCLESDPARRYADVAALRGALHSALTRRSSRWRVVLAASVLACMAVGGLAAIYFSGENEPFEARAESAKVKEQPDERPSLTVDSLPAELPGQKGEGSKDAAKYEASKTQVVSPVNVDELANDGEEAQPPETTGPKSKPAVPPTPLTLRHVSPLDEEDYFNLSTVTVRGHSTFAMNVEIEARQANEAFRLKEGADIVWVVEASNSHRIDTPFKLPEHGRKFKVEGRLSLDIRDQPPFEFYIAERWYAPERGSRRLSNVVRVNGSDIRSAFGPTVPRGGTNLVAPISPIGP
jgi:serine/threonine protein kinase